MQTNSEKIAEYIFEFKYKSFQESNEMPISDSIINSSFINFHQANNEFEKTFDVKR